MKGIKVLTGSTSNEIENRTSFMEIYRNNPVPEGEILSNLGLFINRQALSRILFMHELYKKIIDVHGVVIEFGVRWGQNLALFQSFRGIYEPFNYNRKIIGFDTFSGFPQVDEKDGERLSVGDYSVTDGYENYLEKILDYHESESPISHKKKYELVKGDATKTITSYLDEHPETIVSLAYFDFDIYLPTKKCLEAVLDRVTKGSVLAFDELNCQEFPGETLAVKEVLGLSKYGIKRSTLSPLCSYIVIE
ncbi:MAG: crotonobetainyl-CoA:carnitine CoA-transferase [Peptococcaceae bacterium BICA1-7]|nr:MAG: crotonobetainyl-CoA:carnitine CoA-transferase [Peptococcaceae bacterium BICA1-7]HBV96588.1 crotonobetainyl-CoA--carnitine CoA-transferase [Desulfotomaculum sp.]